jgi:predicted ATP-dependent serine protease
MSRYPNDWVCPSCGTPNRATDGRCAGCGARKPGIIELVAIVATLGLAIWLVSMSSQTLFEVATR